ncbi:Stress responsive A/B Barrel Domain [Peptoclostridium litorale DSM 5388]|uniref:Stress-response A/B barrel domain-containing protein n=1 Tax=Peptoclostridium litorale DSM 5388 TaxID=1121324 RepID=A0A069RHX4_PEPLI|nr:Dabb family protein [Peptoclostridium litorale]KDR96591.1 hypothetical protein CLIT_2c01970 [Peptoclostridium litorale DSM 5388]SIN68736.1 Stress responsive A/B Barrel Domain [Peptoclostridium litorale DSM 5388]
MIRHIVMWKLKESAEGSSKIENAKKIKSELEALKSVIDEIEEIEVGINSSYAPDGNFDAVLSMTCSDFDALKRYAAHPAHQEIVQFMKKIVESRSAVDFEV